MCLQAELRSLPPTEVVPSDLGCGTLVGFHTADAIPDTSAIKALQIKRPPPLRLFICQTFTCTKFTPFPSVLALLQGEPYKVVVLEFQCCMMTIFTSCQNKSSSHKYLKFSSC